MPASTGPQNILVEPVELKILGGNNAVKIFGAKKNSDSGGNTTDLLTLQKYYNDLYLSNMETVTVDGKTRFVITGDEAEGLEFTNSKAVRMLQQNALTFVTNQTYPINIIVKKHLSSEIYLSKTTDNTGADLNAALYSNATTYDISIFVKDTNGDIYQSLVSSNLNNPLSDVTKWKFVWKYLGDLVDYVKIANYLTTFNIANKLLQLNSSGLVNMNLLPNAYVVGEYRSLATSTTPSGFLVCDGAAISRTTYASLFAVIGTNFGVGNGSTTFNLPDFRGRVFGMAGQGSGLTNRTLGASVGTEAEALTTNHTAPHQHDVYPHAGYVGGTVQGASAGDVSTTVYLGKTSFTGGGQPHPNMQPTLFGGYIFIYTGV